MSNTGLCDCYLDYGLFMFDLVVCLIGCSLWDYDEAADGFFCFYVNLV